MKLNIYTTVDGDVLDKICQQFYGKTAGITEQVLQCNPHLADQGAVYPAGIAIKLPIVNDSVVEKQTVQLWD